MTEEKGGKSVLSTRIVRFRQAREGMAYLEFALCLPFILAMLMGAVEVTRYILIVQKAEKTAVTLSDVVAQAQSMSAANLDVIINAAAQVMDPYEFGANGYIIISSVTQTGTYSANNPPTVSWQHTGGGSWVQASQVGSVGGAAGLPGGLTLFDKDNVIVAEVFYRYSPILAGNGIISDSSIYKVGVYKPRLGALSTLSALPSFRFTIGAVL